MNHGRNIGVINLSFGGPASTPLHNAIAAADAAGILVVVASGNGGADHIGDNNDITPTYPASYTDLPNMVSVASTGNLDDLAPDSNFGTNTVHLGAPGIDIYTTKSDGTWGYDSGTSLAAPYVAGSAALLLAKVPDMTPEELRAALMRNVDEISSLATKTASKGRLNAANLLQNNRQMDFGADNSIATDSAGRMYVAYYDGSAKDLKFVARGSDGVWSSVQTIYHIAGNETGHYPSIAIKSSGQVAVAFYDSSLADLRYAELSAGSWATVPVQTTNTVGLYPSLKFDSSDVPAIAYYASSAQTLRFAERVGGTWSSIVAVQTVGATDVGRYPSLALNPNSGMKWAITYHDTYNGDLRFAERAASSSTWDPTVRIDNGSGDRGWYSSLFFDGNDPYVSYYDGINGDLYLTKRISGTWASVPELVTGGSTNSGLYSSLWKDGTTWNIVYLKKGATTADNKLNRAYGAPGAWNFELLESGGGNEARAVKTKNAGQFAYSWYDANDADLRFTELLHE